MKKTIAVVAQGLVPSVLSDKLLNEDDNEIVIVGSLENESVKKVVEQLESEGKKITVVSEDDFKKRDIEKTSLRKDNKTYMLEQSDVVNIKYEYAHDMTKKQMNEIVVPVRTEPKYQNNEPCPCGSGNKYKKCCKSKL